MIHTAVGGYVL